MLSDSQKQFLLELARHAIEASVHNTHPPETACTDPILLEPSGAFVTIRRHGDLRGCIGYLEAVHPLIETIIQVSAKAATDDLRFDPVETNEVPELSIEISVISPMQSIHSMEEIEIGRHGLYVEYRSYRGLLLPQVATASGWDRSAFLTHTFRKAGIPPSLWKNDDIAVFTFTAEIFHEVSYKRFPICD